MNIDRVRAILGVWAPMAIGLFIVVTAINFYFTAELAGDPFAGNLESWRLVCSAGALFVGGLLILSTYGRYTKTKAARREAPVPRPSAASPAPKQYEDTEGHGDRSDKEA